MAVDPKLRRQGIARAMLAACDAAAAATPAAAPAAAASPPPGGHTEIWLHVREGDEPARALYAGFGYDEVEKDAPPAGGLLGFAFGGGGGARRGRLLMRRRLGGS